MDIAATTIYRNAPSLQERLLQQAEQDADALFEIELDLEQSAEDERQLQRRTKSADRHSRSVHQSKKFPRIPARSHSRPDHQVRDFDDPWTCGDSASDTACDAADSGLDLLEELLEDTDESVFVDDKASSQAEDEDWNFWSKDTIGRGVPLYGALAFTVGLLAQVNPATPTAIHAFDLVRAGRAESRRNLRWLTRLVPSPLGEVKATPRTPGPTSGERRRVSALNLAASSLLSSSVLLAKAASCNVARQLRTAQALRFARRSGLRLRGSTNPLSLASRYFFTS